MSDGARWIGTIVLAALLLLACGVGSQVSTPTRTATPIPVATPIPTSTPAAINLPPGYVAIPLGGVRVIAIEVPETTTTQEDAQVAVTTVFALESQGVRFLVLTCLKPEKRVSDERLWCWGVLEDQYR